MSLFRSSLAAILITGPLALGASTPPTYTEQGDALAALQSLQESSWQQMVSHFPELATYVGCDGDHGRWSDYTPAAYEKRKQTITALHEQLANIDRAALTKEYRLQYDILDWLFTIEMEAPFPFEYLSISQLDGIHLTTPVLLQILTSDTAEGYNALLSRMAAFPTIVDQHIELLRRGIEAGIVQPKIAMRSVPQQIGSQLNIAPAQSEYFQAFAYNDNEAQKQEALNLITTKIYPALAKLQAFIADEYLPACRDTIGLNALPNGRAAYAHLVKMHTTTSLSPAEIHQIGLAEVARIKGEMLQTIADAGFQGSIHEYADFLNNDPASYYNTREDLLQGFRDLLTHIDSNLNTLFSNKPSLPCEVVAIPDYSEASSIMAYYYPGSTETNRPGRFFVNTHNLKDHPKWLMESLALHEALPGHHFQITIAQDANIPMIQKHSWTTAFVEGWGLYSESLGKELGLYQSPPPYFGRLTHEMLRALRLVVDTGIHEFNWSREQAINYYKENLPLDEHEITNEIDRYIVMPAQALAYKIGELTLLSLRKNTNLTPQEFHHSLLQLGGCLPLNSLTTYFNTP